MKHKIIEEIKKSIKSKYNISDDTKISIEKPFSSFKFEITFDGSDNKS